MFLRYTQSSPPIPLGLYDTEDDIPGVDSIEVPTGDISRFIRDVTRFIERLDDLKPGLGDFIERLL